MFSPPSPLVSVSWLWDQLQSQQPTPLDQADQNTQNGVPVQPQSIVIVDCRFSLADPHQGRSLYAQGHLPGAVYLDLNQDLSSPPSPDRGRHPLPDLQILAAKLATIGVNFQDTWVVAYDDSRFAFASRLWWLLRYLGHDRVAVLDGGLVAWQAQGYPLSSQIPQPAPGHFVPQIRPEMSIDRLSLKGLLPQPGSQSHLTLIDSREAPRYRGEVEPIDPVAGHIPGAINACWQVVTTDQGWAQPLTFHQAYWNAKLRLSALQDQETQDQEIQEQKTEETIVVYCGSGVTACVNLLSLTLAGFPQAKLYPGSWSEWCHCESEIARGDSSNEGEDPPDRSAE
ncbi:MAG: sulfurtransferase [Prochlorotrichaceae cyanobacterium]